jgi:sugar transferase EpsL
MKRALDLAVAIPLLVLLSPLLVVVALIIRSRMGGQIIFRQMRPGRNGVPFELYKFRSMTDARDPHGQLLPNRERLTPIGRFLRKTSIDELPQLVNVVKGDISLVGPRPLRLEYLPLYDDHQRRRHDVRPGITGWAQVQGRNLLTWEKKFEYDVWYVENQSICLDLQILLMTLRRVLKGTGVNHSDEVTMEPFRGSRFDSGTDESA